MPGSWAHLARRFAWSFRVEPLSPAELRELSELIDERTLKAYLQQNDADQRHGLEAARYVRERDGHTELVVAALCHDLGKRHARLGITGRVIASVLARLRLPAPGRLGVYLDHPALGAAELQKLGLGGLATDYAAHHHGARPESIDPHDWRMLSEADSTFTGDDAADN
ncbi:MAG: hypothetical protein WD990_02695 [Acidimicrobiia bacterium]